LELLNKILMLSRKFRNENFILLCLYELKFSLLKVGIEVKLSPKELWSENLLFIIRGDILEGRDAFLIESKK